MTVMPRAGFRECGHEECGHEPCRAAANADYDIRYHYDDVWGWVTVCGTCERVYPGDLPAEHIEESHAED